MFNQKSKSEKTALEMAIDQLHAEMAGAMGDSEEYDRYTDQLTKLYKLREHDAPRRLVNPDTLVLAGANVLGIILIVGHERAHVVTSKALNFVMKLR
jgi:hypothetical protein